MFCTGDHCERRNECARYYMNAPAGGQIHTLDSLYYSGSGSMRSDGTIENHYWCSPLGDWGAFIPIKKTRADHIRSMGDEALARKLAKVLIRAELLCKRKRMPDEDTLTEYVLKSIQMPMEEDHP